MCIAMSFSSSWKSSVRAGKSHSQFNSTSTPILPPAWIYVPTAPSLVVREAFFCAEAMPRLRRTTNAPSMSPCVSCKAFRQSPTGAPDFSLSSFTSLASIFSLTVFVSLFLVARFPVFRLLVFRLRCLCVPWFPFVTEPLGLSGAQCCVEHPRFHVRRPFHTTTSPPPRPSVRPILPRTCHQVCSVPCHAPDPRLCGTTPPPAVDPLLRRLRTDTQRQRCTQHPRSHGLPTSETMKLPAGNPWAPRLLLRISSQGYPVQYRTPVQRPSGTRRPPVRDPLVCLPHPYMPCRG